MNTNHMSYDNLLVEYKNAVAEIERLKDENRQLRSKLESYGVNSTNHISSSKLEKEQNSESSVHKYSPPE